ncbi:MAG: N-acetyltransferase [Thermodesulfobacteriota bacterium]
MIIRKARTEDVKAIYALIEEFSRKGDMLPRPILEIYKEVRSFFVCTNDSGEVVGTCSLAICLEGLGEVRSLAVKEGSTGKGAGSLLVNASLEEARDLGLAEVFALTYTPPFFAKLGFLDTEKEKLPHKIWGECVNCAKFPNCDENAVIIKL